MAAYTPVYSRHFSLSPRYQPLMRIAALTVQPHNKQSNSCISPRVSFMGALWDLGDRLGHLAVHVTGTRTARCSLHHHGSLCPILTFATFLGAKPRLKFPNHPLGHETQAREESGGEIHLM